MVGINQTGKGPNINQTLQQTERSLNQLNEQAKKGQTANFKAEFEKIKKTFQDISAKPISSGGQVEEVDENLKQKVLTALNLLEQNQAIQKTPNILAVIKEVKGQIQLIKKGAKVEKTGKAGFGGGKGGGA